MESIAVLIVLFLTVGFPLFLIGYVIFHKTRFFYWRKIRPIDPLRKIILEKYFSYYRNLPVKLKKKFENRVELFIRSKNYTGQDGLEITEEMKVLIAATAVQITFGFRFFQLPQFTKIFVYPSKYLSRKSNRMHKGEVYPMGKYIALSWDNFLKGYQDPDDGINLGIHEMTHAMSLENKISKNGVSGFISPAALRKWKPLASQEMARIKTNNESFFRSYASVNLEEFLAVTVEVFFEKPTEFATYNPSLFKATCKLLNQYPNFE